MRVACRAFTAVATLSCLTAASATSTTEGSETTKPTVSKVETLDFAKPLSTHPKIAKDGVWGDHYFTDFCYYFAPYCRPHKVNFPIALISSSSGGSISSSGSSSSDLSGSSSMYHGSLSSSGYGYGKHHGYGSTSSGYGYGKHHGYGSTSLGYGYGKHHGYGSTSLGYGYGKHHSYDSTSSGYGYGKHHSYGSTASGYGYGKHHSYGSTSSGYGSHDSSYGKRGLTDEITLEPASDSGTKFDAASVPGVSSVSDGSIASDSPSMSASYDSSKAVIEDLCYYYDYYCTVKHPKVKKTVRGVHRGPILPKSIVDGHHGPEEFVHDYDKFCVWFYPVFNSGYHGDYYYFYKKYCNDFIHQHAFPGGYIYEKSSSSWFH